MPVNNSELNGDNEDEVSLQDELITASIEGSEIPDDTELRTELEARGVFDGRKTPLFHLKVSFFRSTWMDLYVAHNLFYT